MLLPVKTQPWERKATRAVASGLSGGGEVIGLNGKRPVDDDAATKAPGEASSGAVMATHTRGRGREEEDDPERRRAHLPASQRKRRGRYVK